MWTYNTLDECAYETTCGHMFVFNYSFKEKDFIWCPYCGKPIDEKIIDIITDDEDDENEAK